MDHREKPTLSIFEYLIPWFVLAILLFYTSVKFFQHSYIGFRVDSGGGVIYIFDENQPALKTGDRLIQVDSIRWDDFRSDLRKPIFQNIEAGDVVTLLIERDESEMTIPWEATGFNINEFLDLIVNEGWLAFFFWAAGTFTLVNMRPRDERWVLMIAFNYLLAIILVTGSGVSFYHIWSAAIILRMAVWLCVPVLLHLHWNFAPTFRKLPKALWGMFYAIAVLLAASEFFQILPQNLFYDGFLLAFGGSFILLLIHVIRQPQIRKDFRLLLLLSFVAIVPSILTGIIVGLLNIQLGVFAALIGGGALFSLPLLPLAYFYSAYRRQLGDRELRVNRILSLYVFVIVLGLIGLPLLVLLTLLLDFRETTLFVGLVAAVFATAISILAYPAFQAYLESRIFGIPLPSKQLLERYSNHISTSASTLDLTRVLHDEILSSLLIRQFVFLYSEQGALKVLSILGLQEEQVPHDSMDVPLPHGIYRPPASHPHDWMRLILPLKFGDRVIGFWLFGRRDPDDLYPQAEILILRSLASQTAVALSNIIQTRHIKELYETNILSHEEERLRLARDLHDSVLNELAALVIGGEAPVFSPKFQQAYEAVTERLREIVSDLRPPMLNFGLKLALEGLADKLMERNHNSVQIAADIVADGECRFSESIEINIYRIVQESCRNALRYAHAKSIRIFGSLTPASVDVTVEDDGIGFATETSLKLDEMLALKHFGLVNMLERADLIGAEIKIASKPGQGTKVWVRWENKESI